MDLYENTLCKKCDSIVYPINKDEKYFIVNDDNFRKSFNYNNFNLGGNFKKVTISIIVPKLNNGFCRHHHIKPTFEFFTIYMSNEDETYEQIIVTDNFKEDKLYLVNLQKPFTKLKFSNITESYLQIELATERTIIKKNILDLKWLSSEEKTKIIFDGKPNTECRVPNCENPITNYLKEILGLYKNSYINENILNKNVLNKSINSNVKFLAKVKFQCFNDGLCDDCSRVYTSEKINLLITKKTSKIHMLKNIFNFKNFNKIINEDFDRYYRWTISKDKNFETYIEIEPGNSVLTGEIIYCDNYAENVDNTKLFILPLNNYYLVNDLNFIYDFEALGKKIKSQNFLLNHMNHLLTNN